VLPAKCSVPPFSYLSESTKFTVTRVSTSTGSWFRISKDTELFLCGAPRTKKKGRVGGRPSGTFSQLDANYFGGWVPCGLGAGGAVGAGLGAAGAVAAGLVPVGLVPPAAGLGAGTPDWVL